MEATAVVIKAKNENILIISIYNFPSKRFNKNDYDKIIKTALIVTFFFVVNHFLIFTIILIEFVLFN